MLAKSLSKPKKRSKETSSTESGSEESEDGRGEKPPDREEIFEVLSNKRRRYVLAYLRSHDGEADVPTLATQVSAAENDIPVDQLDSAQRKSTYVGLRQTHLPKMEEYNLIEYDPRRGEVRLTEQAAQAQMYLEYVPENDIPWSHHYLGISILMGLITLLTVWGVFPFAGLGGTAIAVITWSVVGFSAVVHAYYNRRNRLDDITDFEREG